MALKVPQPQIAHIKVLAELPDEKIDAFLDALTRAEPKFNVYDLSAEISGSLGLQDSLTTGILRVLASLYLTRDRKQTVTQFVDRDIYTSLKTARAFAEENADAQWAKLRKFFIKALSLERSIGTAAKAGPVLTEHEHIFAGARIITDFRPIFHVDVSEKPDAAVIVHMLKITERDYSGQTKDTYFALDSNDLASMRQIIDRAIEKEKTLRNIVKDSGVTVLTPKLVF